MKKILFLFIIFLTSCTNYTELNNLSIIKSIGITFKDNTYTLYTQIIDIDDDDNPKTQIVTISDSEFDNLFLKLEKESNKELFLSHIDLLLIDFTIIDNNYNDIINYFINNINLRNDFHCVLTEDIENTLNNAKYNEIEKLINSNNYNNNIITISFERIINKYLSHKPFQISEISFNDRIIFKNNYKYLNNHYERIDNEKEN